MLRDHIISRHTSEKTHRCPHCNYAAKLPRNLSNHVRNCKAKVGKNTQLTDDRNQTDDSVNTSKSSVESSASSEPIKHSKKLKTIPCEKCGRIYRDMSSLQRHHMMLHPSQIYKCSICSYSTGVPYRYHDHMRIHNNDYPHKCLHCKFATIHSHVLRDHILTQHETNVKNHKCPHCDYTAKLPVYLKRHINRLHQATEIRFRCDKCNYGTATKQNLTHHYNIHKTEAPFTCPDNDCLKSFKSAKHLRNHIYSKRRDFACSECDKNFPSQPELKKHMIMHTGIKENVCRICQARYAHLSGLNQHFKVNHAGHLPFHCKQCNFFAANIKIFKNHKNSLVHLQSSAISLERIDPTKL